MHHRRDSFVRNMHNKVWMSKSKKRRDNLVRIYRRPSTYMATRIRKRISSQRYNILATWSSLLTWGNNKTWGILISRVISCLRGEMSIKMLGYKAFRNKMIWWLQIKWKNESKPKVLGGKVYMMMTRTRMVKLNRSMRMKIRIKMTRKMKMKNKKKKNNKIINLNNSKLTPWDLNPIKSNNWSASCFQWTNQQTHTSRT